MVDLIGINPRLLLEGDQLALPARVADQRDDPDSMLSYVRELIRARRELGPEFRLLDAPDGVLAYQRGDRVFEIEAPG